MANDLDTVFNDSWGEDHRSGVVAVVGRPNAGKSTLINTILGSKIAIVTPKPQTTRKNQLGIYTTETEQILFTDTPGIHQAERKLSEYMMQAVENSLRDPDVIVWIIDTAASPHPAEQHIATLIQRFRQDTPLIIALNKIDQRRKNATPFDEYVPDVNPTKVIEISAKNGDGVDALLDSIREKLPLGPRYYPVDQISEANLRFIAAEIIREKVILNTGEEIPHATAVEVQEFIEEDDGADIYAMIYVERESQKGIVLGKGGKKIKQIGTEARKEIEQALDTSVYLDLRVKVLKNWRSNENFMRRVGYRMGKPGKD